MYLLFSLNSSIKYIKKNLKDLLEPDEDGFESYRDVITMFSDCISLGIDEDDVKVTS